MKRFSIRSYFIIIALVSAFALPPIVRAAPLDWSTSTTLSLTFPATTLTIASGSVADALQVNATSAMVTLSQTTGGSFIILSPSYDLTVATSSGGGTVSISCSGGIETATLSQSTGSTVYTVAPGGTNCASASPPVITNIAATNVTTNSATITWSTNIAADSTVSYGTTTSYGATSTDSTLVTTHSILVTNLSASTLYHYAVISAAYGTSTTSGDSVFTTAGVTNGGGGNIGSGGSVGVGSQYGTPYIPGVGIIMSSTVASMSSATTAALSSTTTSSTASLTAELAGLQAQLAALLKLAGQSAAASTSTHFIFTRNFGLWNTGSDVNHLQLFLIAEAKGPAAARLKSHSATRTFGRLTYYALVELQKSVGITPASGYVGPKTRAYVNALEQ